MSHCYQEVTDLVRMSKSQLKPSINPEEYDYQDYEDSYRQNSLSAYYHDDNDERDDYLETDHHHRVHHRPGGRRYQDNRGHFSYR